MKEIIAEAAEKFKRLLEKFFSSGTVNVEHAERTLGEGISGLTLDVLRAYYEEADESLLADKAGRKKAGLQVERRREKRRVLTLLGDLEYERTYYRKKDGTYCHPIDAVVGVAENQKVSGGVSLALVEEALRSSYARSSQIVTGGQVSRQTVMNKLRIARTEPLPKDEKRIVPVLHIDADEDHVHLQSGKSATVPLISVYEGIDRNGKRGKCRNIVQYSRFGRSPDELWEEVLTDLERRYDLEGTKIYLHGDGAAWIRKGLEWLPGSVFVLDAYHKNKALKRLVSGIERASGCQYEHLSRQALERGDRASLERIRARMLQRWPERAETITEAMNYLVNNLEAIFIIQTDAEATRGGATEPHISHTLSARLSSRPMGWSRATLERLVPLLASGAERVFLERGCGTAQETSTTPSAQPSQSRLRRSPHRAVPFSLGLPHPDLSVTLPAKSGKVTPLYIALRPF